MNINSSVTLAIDSTVGMLAKLVRQYIESGELSERFAAFDKTEVEFGKGFEIDVVLAATKQSAGTKAAEHGTYAPTVMSLAFDTPTGGQYAVTMDEQRVRECVGDVAAQQQYAAELTESLYQGWIDDKNAAVAAECAKIIAQSAKSGGTVTLGADVDAYAQEVLRQLKTVVEDIREGYTGTEYGNTAVGSKRIAARDVAIVMSNALAATLDVNGYAKVFSPEYLQMVNVIRITSSRIEEGTVLITDARNIQVRRKYERLVGPIQNSDGSYNMFYNKYDYISAAIGASGTYANVVAFPFYVIKTTEAS